MRNCSIWSSLALFSAMADPSLAAEDIATVTTWKDIQRRGQEVVVTAHFTTPHGCQPAELLVTARIKPGYWLYSVTQPSGGPHRTIIELEQSPAFRLREPFTAIQQPFREKTEWPDWPVLEKHLGSVTWHARIEFAPGVYLSNLTIKGTVRGQVDTEAFCLMPTAYLFVAAQEPPGICKANPFMDRLHGAERKSFCGWRGWMVNRYPHAASH